MSTLMPPGTAIRAAAAYFALVFGAGFLLGSVRVPFLVPRIGERLAELLEAPVMLVVIFYASRHVVRRHGLTTRTAVAAGLSALALLAAAELALSVAMFDRSVSEYISRRDPVSGSVYLASLLLYAALPWLHARRHDRAQA